MMRRQILRARVIRASRNGSGSLRPRGVRRSRFTARSSTRTRLHGRRDSASVYFSVQEPLDHDEAQAREAEWQDVIRWREQDRGDVLLKLAIAPAIANALATPLPNGAAAAKAAKGRADTIPAPLLPADAKVVAKSAHAIDEIAPAPNGKMLAFLTGSIHRRTENPANYEIFQVSCGGRQTSAVDAQPGARKRLTMGRWIAGGCILLFRPRRVRSKAHYRDVQGRLYRVDGETGKVERLGAGFDGSFDQFALLQDGREVALGLKGTETQLYLIDRRPGDETSRSSGDLRGIGFCRQCDRDPGATLRHQRTRAGLSGRGPAAS